MAHSAREILNKIGDLLVEINEEYASIEQNEKQQDTIGLGLLVAKTKYLTANLEVLAQLSQQAVVESGPEESKIQNSKKEIWFTPPTEHKGSQSSGDEIGEGRENDPRTDDDEQKVEEDIEETENPAEAANDVEEDGIEEEDIEEIGDSDETTDDFQEEKTEVAAVEEYQEDEGIEESEDPEEAPDEIEEEDIEEAPKEAADDVQEEEVDDTSVEEDQEEVAEENVEDSENPEEAAGDVQEEEAEEIPTEQGSQTVNQGAQKDEGRVQGQDDALPESSAQEQEVESDRSQPEAVVNEVVEEQREVTVSEPEPTKEEEEAKPTRPLTLNEIIQQQKKAGLTNASQFSTSTSKTGQILDLKSGVSLNDKLLFIKDLFNGYSLAYTEAIELLNRFDNFAEADAFLQANYAMKNNWNAKPQTVDKLYGILRRKFD